MNSKETFINALERAQDNDNIMYSLCERIIGLRRDDVIGNENTLDDEEKRILQQRGGSLEMANLFATINTLFPDHEQAESIPDINVEAPTIQQTVDTGTPITPVTIIPQPMRGNRNGIRVNIFPEFAEELARPGDNILQRFLIDGITDENCNQLLRYFCETISHLLSTVEKYASPDREFVPAMEHFQEIERFFQLFNEGSIYMKRVNERQFRYQLNVFFPEPSPILEGQFNILLFPFNGVKRMRSLVYGHMIYMFLIVNLLRDNRPNDARELHTSMLNKGMQTLRIVPLVTREWKWRIAKKHNSVIGLLHFLRK